MKIPNKLRYNIDFLFPVIVWILIFGKNIFSNLMFVDYVPSTFFDTINLLKLNDFSLILNPLDLLKLILSVFNLLPVLFTISVLFAMLVSYFYIKKMFSDKQLIFVILFSLVYFFNPFVYSRIMIGQLGVLVSYFLMPVFLFYTFEFFNSNFNKRSIIKLVFSWTVVSLFSVHFFVLNLIVFLVAGFFMMKGNLLINNKNKHIWKGQSIVRIILVVALIAILLVLLNFFWIQGFFSNNIFSAIDYSHENFFSPKMSQDIPAVAKIIGMYGFWRENGYIMPYSQMPYLVTAAEFVLIVFLMLLGYFLSASEEKYSKIFFTLFWIGLILGTGISHPYTKPFFDYLFNHMPFFGGFRDSHKFVSLIALAYSYFIPTAIISLTTKIKHKLNKINSPANLQKRFNLASFLSLLTIILVVMFILSFTYPLIGLDNQIKPVDYPRSYYLVNNYLESQNTSGYIIYLPFQTYLTYSWSINSSSDGRISVPVNQIIRKPVLTGPDRYGAGDKIMNFVSDCLSKESVLCLENISAQYVLLDKCAYFPDKYEWITKNNTPVYLTECLDVYKINNTGEADYSSVPLRFIFGVIVSLITFIAMVFVMRRKG
jgi:hypothetical protein